MPSRSEVMWRTGLCIGLSFVLACGPLAARSNHLIGAWGGPHVGIVFEGALAEVKLDCAAGTIDDVLPPQGKFVVDGTYRVATRGQQDIDRFFRSEKAKYTGEIGKDSMTLTIVRNDGTTLGPFTLTPNGAPQLARCE